MTYDYHQQTSIMNHVTISFTDFNSICRVCLRIKENMMSVQTPKIVSMFEECTSLQESLYEKLPQQICYTCFEQLKTSYDFKQQCVVSLEILCEILIQEETNSEALRKVNHNTKFLPEHITHLKREKLIENNSEIGSITGKSDNDFKIENNYISNIDALVNDHFSNKNDLGSELNSGDENEHFDQSESHYDLNGDPDSQLPRENKLSEKTILLETRQKSLAEILRIKYNIYDLKCNICNKELSTRATLMRHMDTHDTNRSLKYHCTKCKKRFYTVEHLKKHEIRHLGQKKYQCDKCPKRFYVLSALGVHCKTTHKVKSINCNKCELQFYHQLQLENHEQTVHEKKEFICDTCGKIFPLRCHLKEHQITHSEERHFTCHFCYKQFKHKGSLKDHIKLQHIEPERREMCNVCGKLILPSTLRSHLESHDKETVYPCPECGRVYNSKYVMRTHMKEKHSGTSVNKYHCEICNKALCSKGTLATHMRITHSDDAKKIKCHICGKAYKLVSNVNVHIKNAHMDIRPHICPTCSKAFHSKFELKNHMRSHTGERPFSCNLCGKAFGFKTVLKTHMKVHLK